MKFLKTILNIVLPRACLLCTQPASTMELCTACYNDLPRLYYVCSVCAGPLSRFQSPPRCGYCQKNPALPFDRTFALLCYQQPVTKLIMDLKFGQALINGRLLGQLLLEKIQDEWYQTRPLPEVIIPIPLHPKRLRSRGYNQAIEIGKPIAKQLKIPLERQACHRIQATMPQATLSATERDNNVKSAFAILKPLSYSHVAVLDDVITTGATIRSFCMILKQFGVQTIDIWSCSRPHK